jgi:SulP family sulfate permease
MGALVNFLSHAVVSGFTSAAALVIALSQARALTGIDAPRSKDIAGLIGSLVDNAGSADGVTLAIGAASVALLLFSNRFKARWFRAAPLVVVALGSAVVALTGASDVRVVGNVPAGLPSVSLPSLDWANARPLVGGAVAIALVGFMESYAVAKSLASRRRERIDANRELVGLGVADLGAALTAGYPVTGGFSRSLVNSNAGARSPLASIITAALIANTLLWLTPLFRTIPHAALAAIIVVAVAKLIDLRAFPRLWKYSKADGTAWLVTFATVLVLGVEPGIITGAIVALGLHLWRTSRPHIAIVGRVGTTEHFRNVERHEVETHPHLLAARIDESLYFANAAYLEQWLLSAIADRPEVTDCVLIMSAVNFIDGGALETLEHLAEELREGGVTLHFAEVKGPVMDRLETAGFLEQLAPGRVFLSTHDGVKALT